MNFKITKLFTPPYRRAVFTTVFFIIFVSLMGNLNALVDAVLHPEIPYFDDEHLIVGSIAALFTAILLILLITYVKRLEHSLTIVKETEQKFKNLIETTTDFVWEVDAQGIYTYASPKIKDLLGYEPAELIGKTPFDLMPEEEAEKDRNFFKQIVINKEPFYGLENMNLHKDGHLVVLETNGIPVFDQKGELKGYRGIDRDITERKKAEKENIMAREKLEHLLTSASGIIYTSKAYGDFGATYISPGIVRMTGYNPEEYIKDSGFWVEHIHPEDRQRILEETQKLLSMIGHAYEYRFLHKDGRYIWVRDEARLIKDKDGNPIEIVGFWLDITERKRSEELLRNSEAKYRTIVESVNDGIVGSDVQSGEIVLANKNMCDMTGYTEEELLRLTIKDIHPKEDRDGTMQKLHKAAHGQIQHSENIAILTKKRRIIYCAVSGGLIEHQGRKILLGFFRDITDRKNAEEELWKTRNYLENLINHANAAIILCDPESNVTRVNFAFELLTGYTSAEVIGQKLYMLFPKETKDESISRIERALNGEYWESVEIPILCKDGDIKIALWNSANIYADDGKTLLATMAQGQDITERKMMEEELEKHREHLEREVENRTRELKESQAMLIQAEKMAGIGTLAGGIAHEVNNPLAAILTYAQLMQSKIKNGKLTMDKVMEYANKMEKVAMHCKATIQNLLDFSRETKDSEQPLSLPEVIDASISLMFHQLELQNIKFSKEMEDVTILADKNQLMQVFVNMLTNAKDAMPEGGELTIAAQKLDGHVKIVFSDTGAGISKDDLKSIFTPFFTTKEVGKGTGIGLYMCYKIIENMGGAIEVKSEIGKGTTFTIKLPV